jgi:hypothetical protein
MSEWTPARLAAQGYAGPGDPARLARQQVQAQEEHRERVLPMSRAAGGTVEPDHGLTALQQAALREAGRKETWDEWIRYQADGAPVMRGGETGRLRLDQLAQDLATAQRPDGP